MEQKEQHEAVSSPPSISTHGQCDTPTPNDHCDDDSECNAIVGVGSGGAPKTQIAKVREGREGVDPSRNAAAWVTSVFDRRAPQYLGRRRKYSDFARTRVTAMPMAFRERVWNTLKEHVLNRKARRTADQYRIPPRTEITFAPLRCIHSVTEGAVVRWTLLHYRTTYVRSFFLFVAVYFILIYIYAFWLRSATASIFRGTGEECLPGFDYENPDRLTHNFNAAFELSWNTFSTVGYGVISIPPDLKCTSMRILRSTEAFIGVLYVGFCGAIIMAKITRNLVTASVTFSSAVCLQYGSKMEVKSSRGAGTSSSNPLAGVSIEECAEDMDLELSTFPYLEFRVVNQNANRRDGEITFAAIECTVNIVKLMEQQRPITTNETIDEADEVEDIDNLGTAVWKRRGMPTVKRRYRHVPLNHSTHSFFTGAWYFHHTLDHSSPFLRRNIKDQIEKLGGWPTSWNTPTEMRAKLNPHIFEFGLIFTGTSSLTVNEVMKTHAYKPEDIYIGWKFVPMSYSERVKDKENNDHTWKVDESLVHDIVPQEHGSHEPLDSREPENNIVCFLRDQASVPVDD